MKIKAVFKTIIFSLILLLVFFGCLESYFRFVRKVNISFGRYPVMPDLLGDHHSHLNIKHKGVQNGWVFYDWYTTNSQGLRGQNEYSLPKKKNTFRILCLGDSFTFGTFVKDNETYPAKLQEILTNKYKDKINVEVINAGMQFYNAIDEYYYYREKGYNFDANLVIVGFNYNDINDLLRPVSARREWQSDYPVSKRVYIVRSIADFVFKKSRFANFCLQKYAEIYKKKLKESLFINKGNISLTPLQRGITDLTKEEKDVFNMWLGTLKEESIIPLKRFWDKHNNIILMLKNKVESDHAEFLYLFLPDTNCTTNYWNAASKAMIPFLKQHNINFLDMQPIFRNAYTGDNELIFFNDVAGHPSPFGYQLIAEEITKILHIEQKEEIINLNVVPQNINTQFERESTAILNILLTDKINLIFSYEDTGIIRNISMIFSDKIFFSKSASVPNLFFMGTKEKIRFDRMQNINYGKSEISIDANVDRYDLYKAEVLIKIETKEDILKIVFCFLPFLFNDLKGDNYIKIFHSDDNKNYILKSILRSDKSNTYYDYHGYKIVEIIEGHKSRTHWIKLEFSGNSKIALDNTKINVY